MRIAVTGATGNVGTALLRSIAADHDVVALSRRRPPSDVPPYDRVTWMHVDLSEPGAQADLRAAFTGADAVVHLAWLIQPSHNRELMRRTNQDGSRAVFAAAADAGVAQIVHASSLGAYSPATPGQVVDESWPTDGVASSPYSVDKVAAERLLDTYEDRLTVTRIRPTLVLQRDSASEIGRYFLGRLLPTLVRPALLKLAPWPKQLKLQFVHADDVAAAIEVLLTERAGGAFNIAADPIVDRQEFARIFGGVGPALPPQLLRAGASLTWRARLQPTDPGWVDIAVGLPLLDTARLRALGWTPIHRGDDTLKAFVGALSSGQGHAGPLLFPQA